MTHETLLLGDFNPSPLPILALIFLFVIGTFIVMFT